MPILIIIPTIGSLRLRQDKQWFDGFYLLTSHWYNFVLFIHDVCCYLPNLCVYVHDYFSGGGWGEVEWCRGWLEGVHPLYLADNIDSWFLLNLSVLWTHIQLIWFCYGDCDFNAVILNTTWQIWVSTPFALVMAAVNMLRVRDHFCI